MFPKLLLLQEEDPQLHIVWNERARGISVQLMGRVQAEVFKSLVSERFGVDVALDAGHIMYRETIAAKVEGVGHFEPLRHYAEVHLIMEPLPRGSGIVVDSVCGEDELDRNWQRLILGHVLERPHPGVLTGSPLTDVKITLAAGRAHLKHTEGGDFRQATYRAIRQGLMQAESVLLEPYYAFTLEAPPEQIGRAISDLRAMGAEFSSPEDAEGLLRVRGAAPVAAMNGYMAELTGYTHGRGRLALRLDSYRPCRNARAVIDAIGYDPLADTENTPDSVFCAHGAGFNVSWDKVKDYMHLDSCLRDKSAPPPPAAPRRSMSIDERELEAIMEREFGPIKRPEYRAPAVNAAPAVAALSGGMKQRIIWTLPARGLWIYFQATAASRAPSLSSCSTLTARRAIKAPAGSTIISTWLIRPTARQRICILSALRTTSAGTTPSASSPVIISSACRRCARACCAPRRRSLPPSLSGRLAR